MQQLTRAARSSASVVQNVRRASTKAKKTIEMPQVHLRVGPTHASRLQTHYHQTLAPDLVYLQFPSQPTAPSQPKIPSPTEEDPTNPYAVGRPFSAPRGNRPIRPIAPLATPENVTKLESIVLHTMVKEAISNKHALITAIAAFRAMSGMTSRGGGISSSQGVQIITSTSGVAEFKVRAGLELAVKVEIKGDKMYDFLGTLVDFVLPRMREFPGIVMPAPSATSNSVSAMSGVVAFGLPPTAMGLFPQVEINQDSYPRMHGFHMHFLTNAKGKGAQNRARALLSGFQIPFVRR